MKISNVTSKDLSVALEATNKGFNNNVVWNNYEQLNKKGTRFSVTLKVLDSRGDGARRGFPEFKGFNEVPDWNKRRHLPYACWHVHGKFFDSLPPEARIYLSSEGLHRPGDDWQDRNIGTDMFPYYFSEACDCEGL